MANDEKALNQGTPVPLENRVASLFVHVKDLRKSAEWYSRLLGLPLMEERLNGGPVYWFDFEGTHLILDSNAANRDNPDWDEAMMPRLMFKAKDIDEAYSYIREKGEPFFEPERHGTMAYFNFRDPEGNAQMACWSAHTEEADMRGDSPIVPRIGGAFIDVKDMPAAARWYSELLGVPFNEEAAKQPIYSLPVSGGAALLLDQHRFINKESFTELFFFETKDFDAALSFVRSEGFEMAGEPRYFPDLNEFALLDPDGNRIVVAYMK